MPYYHELITDQSFVLLKVLKRRYNFILIGGWAVWAWTKALKSKDIDLIVEYNTLGKLRETIELVKNERLKKYEFHQEGIDIDIYLPHYSNLGVPIEAVMEHTQIREGFVVPEKELLLILKQHVWQIRRGTVKGEKDKVDIISLVMIDDFDFNRYKQYAKQYRRSSPKDLSEFMKETVSLPELNLNRHQMARLRQRIFPLIDHNR